ncbi:hypothetical protein J1N35_000288 [Gossypium stocksii]|uniref:Uncharacterized protein n=1 Tax=Gossypium stocksii TaxID=47602 RepID=A0A9D4AII1_9ROSI|nr:hypothetical protein J1N35_000288 [Gossypium stocksii]
MIHGEVLIIGEVMGLDGINIQHNSIEATQRRSHNKTYKGLEMSWRFPPKGWLKFNVCGVVFEDKARGGGVLRDEDGARQKMLNWQN